MINSKKKGFTIVELVIVIAVVAILAAVLIPTFSNLIKKANESADIQALATMNKYLALEEVENKPEEIIDVYKALDKYDIKAETYTPLYKGRYYFYDLNLNKVLYVDETYKVIAPAEHKDIAKSTSWRSLNGQLNETEIVATSITYKEQSAKEYKVSTAEELNYVVNNYNPNDITVVTLQNDIDLYGAAIAFTGSIQGKLVIKANTQKTIKNFVGFNQYNSVSESADGTMREYNSAFISVAENGGTVEIENIVFDNFTVETPTAGNVAAVIGSIRTTSGNIIKNVTVSNSTIKGNRSVGALVGMCYDATAIKEGCKIENVTIQSRSGRSGIIIGAASQGVSIAQGKAIANLVTINNSHSVIWEEQKTKAVQVTSLKYEDVIIAGDFTAYEKFDTEGEYYVHADDVLIWTSEKTSFYNGNTKLGETFYPLFNKDLN